MSYNFKCHIVISQTFFVIYIIYANICIYVVVYILNSSIGWGAGLQSSRLVEGKGSNLLKVLIKENKVIYQKYNSAKFGLVSYCH